MTKPDKNIIDLKKETSVLIENKNSRDKSPEKGKHIIKEVSKDLPKVEISKDLPKELPKELIEECTKKVITKNDNQRVTTIENDKKKCNKDIHHTGEDKNVKKNVPVKSAEVSVTTHTVKNTTKNVTKNINREEPVKLEKHNHEPAQSASQKSEENIQQSNIKITSKNTGKNTYRDDISKSEKYQESVQSADKPIIKNKPMSKNISREETSKLEKQSQESSSPQDEWTNVKSNKKDKKDKPDKHETHLKNSEYGRFEKHSDKIHRPKASSYTHTTNKNHNTNIQNKQSSAQVNQPSNSGAWGNKGPNDTQNKVTIADVVKFGVSSISPIQDDSSKKQIKDETDEC